LSKEELIMEENEWKKRRDHAKNVLLAIKSMIRVPQEFEVLLKAECECCESISAQIDIILEYWDERSVASKFRFVEGACNE
jgi:hypothetical protein